MNRGGAAAWVAVLLLGPIAFTVAASTLFVTALRGWQHPYFAQGGRWAYTWWDYALDPGPHFTLKLWLGATAMGGLAAAFLVGRIALSQSKSKLHGRAAWQTAWGAWRSGLAFSFTPRRDAILLGLWKFWPLRLYVSLPGEEHVSLTARTRTGKGVSFVNPNVMNWGGPVLCFSIKRDVINAAAAERERMGDRVFIFDATDPDGMTHRWSGLGSVRRNGPDAYDDIQRAFWFLIPETKAANPYWDNAARKIATAVGVLLAETPNTPLNVAAVLRLIERHDYDVEMRRLIDVSRRQGRPYPAAVVNTLLGWLDRKAEEGAASVRETLTTALSLWHVPRIAAVTEHSDFDLGSIRSQNVSIFVCAQPGDIRRLRPIYGLLFTQLVQLNSRQEFREDASHRKVRLLAMLDEFWALGEMKELADALAFLASYGVRFAVVLQTKDQIVKSFGEEGARNLFNNTGVELIFGRADQKTAQEASDRAGTDTVEQASTSQPKLFGWLNPTKQNETVTVQARPLILRQEVAEIPADVVVVQRHGYPPLKLKRIFWYSDPHFRHRGGNPPPLPPLTVVVDRDDASIALAEEAALKTAADDLAAGITATTEKKTREARAKDEASVQQATKLAQAAAENAVIAKADALEAATTLATAKVALRAAKGTADEAVAAVEEARAQRLATTANRDERLAANETTRLQRQADNLSRAFNRKYGNPNGGPSP